MQIRVIKEGRADALGPKLRDKRRKRAKRSVKVK